MLDQKLLRNELTRIAKQLSVRGVTLDTDRISTLEEKRKALQFETQQLQGERNAKSKAIGIAKSKGEDASALFNEVSRIANSLEQKEVELTELLGDLNSIYHTIPNIPDSTVPPGTTEDDNLEIRQWGEKPTFDFDVLDHMDLGIKRNWLDFENAAKISGARFVVLKGKAARLQRALIQFMLDIHTNDHGYEELYVPYLVNRNSLFGTGQLPKFLDDQFMTQDEFGYALIPTAEIPVTNLARDEILSENELPKKYVTHTPCFRSEAGSYGKDTRGMFRQHQFEKVELVQLVKPGESDAAHEALTSHAEEVLKRLGLHYRVVTLCGGDLGFSAAKTYDIEVWLPSQNRYREISSCSNFRDFQARRMRARWRDPNSKKPELLHTLNGSGLAVGRTVIAIIENFQDSEGNIHIPEALQHYLGGLTTI